MPTRTPGPSSNCRWAVRGRSRHGARPRRAAAARGHMEPARAPPTRARGHMQAAIAASEEALGVFTRERFPNEWGTVQGSLGTAYLDSTHGDRQAAVSKAISYLQAA